MNQIPNELISKLSVLTPIQLAWLSGWCWAKAENAPIAMHSAEVVPEVVPIFPEITVLSASQTGNARKTAETVFQRLQQQGMAVKCISAADYKPKNIVNEQILLLITSTQGEGEPPEEAISLYKFLHGKKAPNLDGLQFAVLGLGDSSYPQFCGAARDFDAKLAELGGVRLLQRCDCDLDFQADADAWIAEITALLMARTEVTPTGQSTATSSDSDIAQTPVLYNKEHPFPATLLTCQKITGRRSDKDVRHIELDLDGSGLQYRPGDALGVWFENDPALIDELLALLKLDNTAEVEIQGVRKTVREAMLHDLDITQNTPHFVQTYAKFANNHELNKILSDNNIAMFAQNTPILSIVRRYPAVLTAEEWVSLLRPITPRLYSISSSPEEVENEVHLTVAVLRYEHNGETHTGAASGYLSERVAEDEVVRVFIEPNPHFRLPLNPDAPVIMIGAGTGIAPFRAFVQERTATKATGKNWLIFGNPHFSEDFLYQTEWQTFAKQGYLHRYSLAWSRDQQEKVYVQDKIRAEAEEFWRWLQNGAYIYVCGDATKMAKDVEQAILEVIVTQGKISAEEADEYLDELRQAKRYQRDVY